MPRKYVLQCNYCKYCTPCQRYGDDLSQSRLERHEKTHHSCRFCGWWPSNGYGRQHWTVSLCSHEATCKAQIEKCEYCDYKPKTVSRHKRMCEHVFGAHVKSCRVCGWKAATVEEWKRAMPAHEACCQQRLQTTFLFLAVDARMNDDVLRRIATLQRRAG